MTGDAMLMTVKLWITGDGRARVETREGDVEGAEYSRGFEESRRQITKSISAEVVRESMLASAENVQ